MLEIDEIINEIQVNPFYENAMITLIVIYGVNFPRALASLIANDKNEMRWNYNSKSDYINYLSS